MKITTLLAQYLYTNKRLDLTGIGSFLLDPSAMIATEGSKQRSNLAEAISFESNPQQRESPELIAYISAQTGKMKALSASDVDSHLQLVHQFLNIGKPFTFEGIGTIVKLKTGGFDYIPGAVASEKMKELLHAETGSKTGRDEQGKAYESFLTEPRSSGSWRKPVIGLLILLGIGMAIWGGYVISKKKMPVAIAAATEDSVPKQTAIIPPVTIDSTPIEPQQVSTPDTNVIVKEKPVETPAVTTTNNTATPDSYKYVLEVAKSKRAFQRYNQLRTNLWAVKLETTDSLQYKLYLLLPSLNADTTRILDSLTVMTGRRVYIEHQN